MKKLTKLLISVILSGIASSANAFVDWPETCLRPYVGLDGQLRTLQYGSNNGGNIFAKNFPQINGYVGLAFNECFAVELGYEYAFKQKRTVRLGPGDNFFGANIPEGDFLVNSSSANIQGVHGSLVGRYPIWDCPNIKLLATIGMTYLRTNLSMTAVEDSFGTLEPITDRFNQSKLVARLGGGLEHMITDCIGVRGLIVWEDTSQFKRIRASTEGGGTFNGVAGLRSSLNYSLGLFMIF